MSGKSKRGNGAKQRGKTGTRNARGQFTKGGPPGPGRGHRRKRGDLATPPTPAGRPSSEPIAHGEELASRLLREAELGRLRGELADERAASARQSREWSLTLAVLAERFPEARRAVLEALWPGESPERAGRGLLGGATAGQAVPAGEAAAEGAMARAGGDQPAGQAAGATPPAGRGDTRAGPGKAGEPTVYDGARRRPLGEVNPAWGGTIERGDGSRDELLPEGNAQELGRGKWGDSPPWRGTD